MALKTLAIACELPSVAICFNIGVSWFCFCHSFTMVMDNRSLFFLIFDALFNIDDGCMGSSIFAACNLYIFSLLSRQSCRFWRVHVRI